MVRGNSLQRCAGPVRKEAKFQHRTIFSFTCANQRSPPQEAFFYFCLPPSQDFIVFKFQHRCFYLALFGITFPKNMFSLRSLRYRTFRSDVVCGYLCLTNSRLLELQATRIPTRFRSYQSPTFSSDLIQIPGKQFLLLRSLLSEPFAVKSDEEDTSDEAEEIERQMRTLYGTPSKPLHSTEEERPLPFPTVKNILREHTSLAVRNASVTTLQLPANAIELAHNSRSESKKSDDSSLPVDAPSVKGPSTLEELVAQQAQKQAQQQAHNSIAFPQTAEEKETIEEAEADFSLRSTASMYVTCCSCKKCKPTNTELSNDRTTATRKVGKRKTQRLRISMVCFNQV